MKTLRILILSVLISLNFSVFAQYENINLSLKTGNATELIKYCSSDIELIFDDSEGVYSKSQAKMILQDFFKKNKPSSFNISHQGGKEGAKYVIGKLETSNGEFRIHYFIRKENGNPFIYQLRITQKKY